MRRVQRDTVNNDHGASFQVVARCYYTAVCGYQDAQSAPIVMQDLDASGRMSVQRACEKPADVHHLAPYFALLCK